MLLVVALGLSVVDGQKTSFKIARGTPRSIISTRAVGAADSNDGQYIATGNEGRYVRSGNEGQYFGKDDARYDHIETKSGQHTVEKRNEYVARAKIQKSPAYRFAKTAFKQPVIATTAATTLPPTETPRPLPPIKQQPRFIKAQPRIIPTQPRLVTAKPFQPLATTKKVNLDKNGQEWLILRNKNEVHQDGYHSL